ncbi:VacB/RNase II family 3'-5' exoribonuclease [bacterium]|nr:VacB/RNase II family 3'-5' exoribonuclease [candidate division CSSED10-310 bacterium]
MSRKKKHQITDNLEQKIIAYFKEATGTQTVSSVIKSLNISGNQSRFVWGKIRDLEKKGILERHPKNRYGLAPKPQIIKGVFKRRFSGSGDIVLDDNTRYSITKESAKYLVDGDCVECVLSKMKKNKLSRAIPLRIFNPRTEPIVGIIDKKSSKLTIKPLDPKICGSIAISGRKLKSLDDQLIVLIVLTGRNKTPPYLTGKIVRVIGKPFSKGVETEILIQKHNLRDEFPQNALEEAFSIPKDIPLSEIEKRIDLRNVFTITVDPKDARDFDDALTIEKTSSGYRLGVHIADVSYYVDKDTAIDQEAYNRGTSVYLPERAIHMLPPRLATDICSLRPGVDRLTLTVWILLDNSGNLISGACEASIIRSDARLSYDEFLTLSKNAVDSENIVLGNTCKMLTDICKLLLCKRIERGVLDLDIPETEFEFDTTGKTIGIHKKKRSIAEQSIEEFMIAANVVVADMLDRKKIKYLRRIHEPPDLNTLKELKLNLSKLGIDSPPNPLDADQARGMLSTIESNSIRSAASYLILRAMRRAVYSPKKTGHYGLALRSYTQFTSPIRRYPDLDVHRAVKRAIGIVKHSKSEDLALKAKWLSDRERIAQEAEWDAIRRLKVLFMKNYVGHRFQGSVTHVEPFGAFIEIDEPYVEGFLPVSRLPEYYLYRDDENALVNPGQSIIIKPGTLVNIIVALVDEKRGFLEFELSSG